MPEAQIGVVVPTLNSAATLHWTLCSLRGQQDITVEIIVADSGSGDGTLDICKQWGVPTIYVPPGNMYRAINAGLRQMETEWVTYLNSDDLVYPTSYGLMVTVGEREFASLVYGDNDFIDFEGRFLFTLKAAPPGRLLGVFRCGLLPFAQPAAIFRRAAFEEVSGFDERYRQIADYDFFYRLISSDKKFVRAHGAPVAAFRRHDLQLSRLNAPAVRAENMCFRESFGLKMSYGDLFDTLYWRLQNSPEYLWRVSRQGDLKWVRRALIWARTLSNR